MQAKVAGLEEALAAEEKKKVAAAAAARSPTRATDSSESGAEQTHDSSEASSGEQDGSEADSESNADGDANGCEGNSLESTQQVIQEFEADEAADEFDYLAYAQDRALFFWADILSLGLVKEQDFPEGMVEHIKKMMIGR